MSLETHNIQRYIGIIVILAVIGGGGYTFFKKKQESMSITYSTSDAGNLKGEFTIALDSWIGYFPFKSPVFGKLMRDSGYRVKIIDDKANYSKRMKMLKKGKIDFAVATVDSYLLNGKNVDFPGIITTVIDESKGGDAIISRMRKVANINQLKSAKDIKIAYTPASPSEHLLKAIAVHFDIPLLKDKEGSWRVEVDGAKEAYQKLMNREVDVAVMWEPHVSEALFKPGYKKLLGSEDVDKLIVDILLVNRKFANKKPELVKLFLKHYFTTLNIYSAQPKQLKQDLLSQLGINNKQLDFMLQGVKWLNYPENMRWFGLISQSTFKQPEIVQTINATINILLNNKDFEQNPLMHKDPYTILNSQFLKSLYASGAFKKSFTVSKGSTSLTKKFKKLTATQWNRLKLVGALKLRPITFRSGTSTLDTNGMEQIKHIVSNIAHYPNFRILVKGHTGLRGDPQANMTLSKKRAKAVKNELQYSYNISPERIRIVGMGSKEPLPKNMGESDRSYNSRLKRVEILFLSGKNN